ncbi:hypothetical protein KDW55_28655, partial [Burkholderia sp. AU19243]|uniref:hypothetical protein n=1 Tax=Burkholderia sp. AU19243 TaxID=2824810 RepID=UPI001BA29A4D
ACGPRHRKIHHQCGSLYRPDGRSVDPAFTNASPIPIAVAHVPYDIPEVNPAICYDRFVAPLVGGDICVRAND